MARQRQIITNFTGGLNLITDSRRLQPNSPKEQTAELREAVNMDIDKRGALITATGYELVTTISGTGGIDHLVNYEKDNDTRFLGIVHDNKLHTVIPSNFTAVDQGSLGTTTATRFGSTIFKGTGDVRRLIVGSDDAAVQIKKFDGSNLSDIGQADYNGSYIMNTFQGRFFAAKGATTNYSPAEDETGAINAIGFNDVITGMQAEGERLQMFTRTYHKPIYFQFDDAAVISTPIKAPEEREFGSMTPGAVSRRGSNIRYWGDDNRIYNLGAEAGVDEKGLPRSVSISEKINPILNENALAARDQAVAIPHRTADQWWLAAPAGASTKNNRIYVYHERWNAWTTKEGFNPSSFALFKNSDYEEEMYFGSALSPQIFKFNSSYTYNGSGYTRRAKFKKFTFGNASVFKEFFWIDIAGSMYLATEILVSVKVDDKQVTYKIDSTQLERDRFGTGYIGDDDIGDLYLGGGGDEDEDEGTGFKRFRSHFHIPLKIREGAEMELTIYNNGANQPWKIDEMQIEYELKPNKKRNPKFIVNTIVAA